MNALYKPIHTMKASLSRLKAHCEAYCAAASVKHIVDQNCQDMGKCSYR